MARKRNSGVEDFLDVISMMPWWINIILALISYLLLSALAVPVPIGVSNTNLSSTVFKQSFVVFGTFGRIVFPILFLLAALVSGIKSSKRKKLYTTTVDANDITWVEFEELTAEYFRRRGFSVRTSMFSGADGGVDVHMKKDGLTYIVQCKQWKAYSVGVAVVREVYGTMVADQADGAYIVTSGSFTPDALDFLNKPNVNGLTLIDGNSLRFQIESSRSTGTTTNSRNILKGVGVALVLLFAIGLLVAKKKNESIEITDGLYQEDTLAPQNSSANDMTSHPEVRTNVTPKFKRSVYIWQDSNGQKYVSVDKFKIPKNNYTSLEFTTIDPRKVYCWEDKEGKRTYSNGLPNNQNGNVYKLISVN